jgi:hypothetical protein
MTPPSAFVTQYPDNPARHRPISRAVTATDRRLAGGLVSPGSGKTAPLRYRTAWLMTCTLQPEREPSIFDRGDTLAVVHGTGRYRRGDGGASFGVDSKTN